MADKSQRRKERHARKRKEKRRNQEQSRARQISVKQPADIPLPSNLRHRQRLAEQVPQAWADELAEDVAIFNDTVLATLTPELAPQATAVREALQLAVEARGDDALERLSVIPRNSPLSQWRLFVRGLIAWLVEDADAASDAWKRLEPQRRPGRIATAMMVALRPDLELVVRSTPQAVDQPPSPWTHWDDRQLYHAKLLRRVCFDRPALRVAEAGVKVVEESKQLQLGPRKLEWLKRFVAEYGDTEPDLTAALAHAALERAFAQHYANLFDEAARSFSGPRHDRRNQLLTFFYYSRFASDSAADKAAQRALAQYLKHDLPKNEALSEPLRRAIASQIHLCEAVMLIRPPSTGPFNFSFLFGPPEDTQTIREHLRAAVKAEPANALAYKTHSAWIESKLDEQRLTKAARASLEKERAAVMQQWSQGVPDAVEPRLWLVDYLLENEQLEQARPHEQILAASRQDDPRVRATPWKWQLLEAMRLSRRKAWLAEVPARLDEAEALWPAWLPKDWLPYLRAAWMLRSGQTEAFEEQHRQICEASGVARGSLADACMMLAAVQQLRAPAAELKPFRAALDQALTGLDTLPLDDLLEAGAFFWDLHRVQLLYPAYRMHGGAIGKVLVARLQKNAKLVTDRVDEQRLQKAVLWASHHRFWPNNYETKLPSCFSDSTVARHPMFVAAKLNAFLKESRPWGADKHRELGPMLRQAAQSQRDAYYRHWFVELANELDDVVDELSMRLSGPFGKMFSSDEDEDDLVDDLGYDPNCDCPSCQAAKKAAQHGSPLDPIPH